MKLIKTNKNRRIRVTALFVVSFLLVITVFNFLLFTPFTSPDSDFNPKQVYQLDTPQLSKQVFVQKSWMENPNFSTTENWNLLKGPLGDNSDVEGNIVLGQADVNVIGDSGELRIDSSLNQTDWSPFRNPDLPILPDTAVVNASGCYVSHLWHENINQTKNRPSVHWKRTIQMPVDMRDYIITSASLEADFNATVSVSPHALPTGGEGIDRFGDANLDDYSTGDYAEFYVLLSDDTETFPPIQVAYNNTGELGRDSPAFSNYSDSPLDIVPENVLISVLTSILQTDGFNFTISLGIDIYCEDNEVGVDVDRWNSLIIRKFNLTFTYEKKVDQFTTAEWNQIGNTINGTNIEIIEANLNFKYKINEPWPYLSSPNSEFKVLINNNSLQETIKLTSATGTFQSANYDVTSLILKDVNISLSIQMYLADEFALDHNITISIDEVFLEISLLYTFPEEVSEPWLFTALLIIAAIATVCIGIYLIAYYKVLKYPIPVRKVRKYSRSLRTKSDPDVIVLSAEKSFNLAYGHEVRETATDIKLKEYIPKSKAVVLKEKILKPEKGSLKTEKPEMTEDELVTKSVEKKAELDKIVEDSGKKSI
ncbi:MAG: hypothetical protein ACW986_13040 [Promethearchaeota archaeon]